MMGRPIILPDHFILGLVIIKKRLMIKKALITLMLCRGDIGRTFFGVYTVLLLLMEGYTNTFRALITIVGR